MAAANNVLRNAWLMALILEKEEEDAGADGGHLQQQRHVSGGFHSGRYARVLRVDGLLDVLRLGADPGQSGPKEEDEPLLRSELQPQGRRQVVVRHVAEQDLRSRGVGETARIAREEVPALEVKRRRQAPLERDDRHASAQSEA